MNLTDIQSALRDANVDAWLFFDHHRRDPLAYSILGLPAQLNPTRRWYYLIPREGEPIKLMHQIEPHSIASLPGRTIVYSSWATQTSALRELTSGHQRIAMQYSPKCAVPYVAMVDAGTIELVRSCGVDVVTSADLVQLFEARWTAAQLESHLEAGRKMDALRRAAFEFIAAQLRSHNRVSEWDVHEFIRQGMEREGLFTDHGPIVGANANASDPHYEPAADRHSEIRPGDFVLIDMWAKLKQPDAVYYDITWTGYCGDDPSSAMQNVFSVVQGGRNAAIARVQAAMSSGSSIQGFEVDDAARNHISDAGFGEYFIHRTGHSLGRDVHGSGANMDNLETHDERTIIPRTCFSIEPGVYLPDFGVRSEINLYIEERSARVTGETQDALVLIR